MTLELDEYPHLVLRGTSYERGFSHGTALKSQIKQLGDHYRSSASLPPWSWCENIINTFYIPALQKYDRFAFDEIRGISDGSKVALEIVMLINARYDLTKYKNNTQIETQLAGADECTTATLIDENSVKIIQNWDLDDYLYENNLCLILESYTSAEEGLPKTLLTFGEVGQLGRSGMNSKGLGLSANALNSNIDFFDFPRKDASDEEVKAVEKKYGIKLPVIPVSFARRKFLSCHSFANGLKYIVQAPRHVSGNVMVATREKLALDFELIPHSYFLLEPTYVDENTGAEVLPASDKRAVLTHSNHFLSPRYSPADGQMCCKNPGGSSFYRHKVLQRRFVDAIKNTSMGKGISVETIKTCVSDTTCYPNSVSEAKNPREELAFHDSTEDDELLMTVGTAIYDLTNGTATFCKGPPHLAKAWKTIKIEME